MKICVYCASSDKIDEKYYELAQRFGKELACRGHELVYGGYTNGMMGKLAVAAHENGAHITAVVPEVFDCDGFTYRFCDDVVKTQTMAERKSAMQNIADVFVILPGGIGTLDEFFDTMDLRAIGILKKNVIVLNAFGFYDKIEEFITYLCNSGFVRWKGGLADFYSSVEEAFDALEKICPLQL